MIDLVHNQSNGCANIDFLINKTVLTGKSKQIKVHIGKAAGMAKVSVSDKGPGIPPDKFLTCLIAIIAQIIAVTSYPD